MVDDYRNRNIYFSTFTIDRWIPLFGDYSKTINNLYGVFDFYVIQNLIKIYSFCVLKDHVHIIWDLHDIDINKLEHSFKSFSAKKIIEYLKETEPLYIDNFLSSRKDRNIKIWKLNSKSIHLTHRDIIIQKIKYVHENPTKGDYFLFDKPEDYPHSSAGCYSKSKKQFPFLTLFPDF